MLINIEQIKIENRIRKDFGNIQELADDIKQNGLINPPVVMQESDNTYSLLTGERRIRALKLLGYKQVEVRTWKSLNEEEKLNIEISENESRKDFSKSERMEYALRLAKIEGLKARERQATSTGGSSPQLTQIFAEAATGEVSKIVAEKLGIGSKENFRKEKYIYENQSSLPPEDFTEWDEGRLSTNKAYQKIKAQLQEKEDQLSKKQESVDLLKQKYLELQEQLKQANNDNPKKEELEQQIEHLKKRIVDLVQEKDKIERQKTKTVVERVEVDKPETLQQITDLRNELQKKTEDNRTLSNMNIEQAQMLSKFMGTSTEYQLVSHCSEITLKMLNFVKEMSQYDYMAETFNSIPLATRMEYARCIRSVKQWADNILETIQTQENKYTVHIN